MSRRPSSSLFSLFLVSLGLAAASAGTFTVVPEVRFEQRTAVHPSPHLTFSLSAHHHSTSAAASSFHPLSHSSAHSSRFATLQYNLATANMTGCASIDFSALVTVSAQGPYRLIVDTGSTTLAVVSSVCTTCNSATPTYTPPAGTETNNDQPISSSYGGGTAWSGFAYTADVAVGDSASVSMAMATIESNSDFIDGSKVCAVNTDHAVGLNTSQGIIGFAYPTIAVAGTDSWITNYVAATGVSNEFTIQMCPAGGNLWVGSYDAAFVGGPFTYVPVIKPNFYAVMLNDISVITYGSSSGPQSLSFTAAQYGPCVSETSNADCTIVDSGTTMLQLPAAIYKVLVNFIEADTNYQAVFGAGGTASVDPLLQTGQCAAVSSDMPSIDDMRLKLPQLQFTFTDANFANPVTLTIASVSGYLSLNYDETGNMYYCAGIGSTSEYTILGYSVMNQYTVRHDLANQRLGFAATAQCGVAAPPLPNYKWTTGDWGSCSVASCGGGVQWRSVDCVDLYGIKHPDIRCGTGYTDKRPADSQTCNTATCASVTAASFSSVTPSSSVVQQGQSITISYAYTGSADFVTLFATPSGSSTPQPSYIARNTTGGNSGSGTYSWYVPSSLTAGTYDIGAYSMLSFGNSIYTSSGALTVQACTSGSCAAAMDVCNATTCNGRGECDVSSDNTAVCNCVSAYNGTNCEQLTGCNTQCVNGGTLNTASCACACPTGFTGPLCEQVYANLTATLSLDPSSTSSSANTAVFQSAFVTDIAYALGLRPNAVLVQSVGGTSSGNDTLVSFQLTSMGSSDTLQVYVVLLASLLSQMQSSTSTLSSGLTSAYVTSIDVVAGPPATSSGSPTSSTASKYWPYIVAGIGGFALIFTLLYCVNGGRCIGCRRDKVDAGLTRIGPKGSGSMNKQGQVVVGGGGARQHNRRSSHEPRHSYFQNKPARV